MKKGFTLVELLVVIAILGILMAMMVPAAGVIIRRAKMAQAKSDAAVVTSVLLKYRAEYNRWPGFATNNETQHLTDTAWVQAMSPAPGEPMLAANPKRIVFFEAGAGALDKTTGAFIDPW
ncbi:MAG TPA: type II secretion system protein, partial [Kiritimatiellia bacterium]|nr:type II secretion system protein [Kiritimatiellia bacterium]